MVLTPAGPPDDVDDEVLRRRWRATGLPTRRPGAAAATASEEVARLGAVQAQEFELTLWSLGRRTGEPYAAVLAAFTRGDYVRTHTLRQTWHVVHRDDLTTVQAATAPRVHQRNASTYRQEGLDPATLARAADVVVAAAAAGPVTRAQVAEQLAAAGIEAARFRLGFLLMWAELECLIVSGPMVGRQHTYVAWPDRTLPDRTEAITRLAQRYFSSHGPASEADFVAWSSLTRTEARRAMAEVGVERMTVAGVEHCWLGDIGADAWASPQVELLNGYDEYVSGLGPAGKRRLGRAGLAVAAPGLPNGLVIVDGQLAGHWRRTPASERLDVEVVALRPFDDAEQEALARSAQAYGDFVGLPADVSVRPVRR